MYVQLVHVASLCVFIYPSKRLSPFFSAFNINNYMLLAKFESKINTETIIYSISQMTSLEELVLLGNYLSRDDKLSDTLSKLTSLKKLNMGGCQLFHLPEG